MSFSSMIRKLFLSPRRGAARKGRTPRPTRKLLVELLEDRVVPTATVFLDFGDAFPAAGLQMTVQQLRDTFANGGIQGPDYRAPTIPGSTLTDANTLTFQPFNPLVTFDYNGDGSVNAQDAFDLRSAAVSLVQRYYQPLNVNVQVVANSSIAGIQATLQANNGLASGVNDSYAFICLVNDDAAGTSVGAEFGLYGDSNGQDIGLANTHDNSETVFADQILGTFPNANADTALGYTSAHEPAHDFGLQHTSQGAAGSDRDFLTGSDIIIGSARNINRQQLNFFTRFPLPTVSGAPATYSPFDKLVTDPDIGPKPGFADYVTGTGAFDQIIVSNFDASNNPAPAGYASVTVNAYRDAAYTSLITSYSYLASKANGILVDAGFRTDQIILDGTLGTTVNVRGMAGNDTLLIRGDGSENATYTPGTDVTTSLDGNPNYTGDIVAGSTIVHFSEFNTSGAITLQNMGTISVNGSAAADSLTLKKSGGQFQLTGSVNAGAGIVPLLFNTASSFAFSGGQGADSFTVDSSNGLITVPISYDGGGGFNTLKLTQTGGDIQTSDVYSVGPNPGEGSSVITGPSGTQSVSFQHLAPVLDNVPSASATVNATNGDNAINYTAGPGGGIFTGNTGLVTVDNQESYEFNNKTNLVINAGAGDDTINLNNPTIPAGLSGSITVNGGDPTTSDTVIVNGTTAQDTIVVDQLTSAGARVAGAQPVTVLVDTTEHLVINGQGGNDSLTVQTPAGPDEVDFVPEGDVYEDSASINISSGLIGPIQRRLPLEYRNIGAGGSVSLTDAGGGRADFANIRGTEADTRFDVNSAGQVQLFSGPSGPGFVTVPINTAGVATLRLRGLAGDDVFNIAGNNPFTTGFIIEGGDPSASDTLNFTASGTTANLVTADFQAATVTEATFTPVSYTGIEIVNIAAAGHNATVRGTTGDDTLDMTPTAADAASVRLTGSSPALGSTPVLNLSGIGTTFTVDALVGADTVKVNGTSGADAIAINKGATTTVQVNGLKTVSLPSASDETVVIAAGDGADTINVSGTTNNSQIVNVQGGDPSGAGDTLTVAMTTAGTTTVTPGATPDAGVIGSPDGSTTFSGIESITVTGLLAGANILTVAGTNGPDTIALQRLGGADRVWVNNRAVVTFVNYPTVNLNGQFGDDVFSVAPAGLATVTTINVNGGDPTASDSVIVTGTTNADAVTIDTLTLDGAHVTGLGGVTVNVTTAEHLTYSGQGGDDSLTIVTPANGQVITLTPGALAGAGDISMRNFSANGGGPLLPLSFTGISANGSLSFADVGGTRVDDLTVVGTDASNVFSVGAAGGVDLTTLAAGGTTNRALITLTTPGVSFLELLGLAGDDTFNIVGNHPFSSGVLVDGGDPSASDTLNFTASATVANLVTGNLGAGTIAEATFGAVSLVGVELVNANANGHNLTLLATTGNDVLSVTPTGANAATAQLLSAVPGIGATPVMNGTNIGTLTVDLVSGSDQLVVNANNNANNITVTGALVTVDANATVNYLNVDDLKVNAQAGNDNIDVTPSANTTISVDGGDPIGSGATPADKIILHPPGANSVEAGPHKDEGGLNAAGVQRVSWAHIEKIVVVGGGPSLTLGTNGDDDITIIARDSSYDPLADGVQDFTVSVNDGPEVLHINNAAALVDALSGDDEIVVREPAPNQAVWNVQVDVAAGAPAAAAGALGDRIQLETPGTQTVTYNPNNPAASIPALGGVVFTTPAAGGGQFSDAANTSTVNATQFTITGFYTSSAGGAEQFVYAGEAGNDTLVYNSPTNGNAGSNLVYTPGANADAGAITGNLIGGATLTPLAFSNLGGGNHVSFTTSNAGRTDRLNVEGSPDAAGENFAVTAANGGTVQINRLSAATNLVTLPIFTPSVNTLQLDGLGGNDVFNLTGALPFTNGVVVNADATVNLNGAVGPVTVVVGDSTPNSPNPNTVITGYGAPVVLIGVDTANLDATNQQVTATGTTQNDNFVFTPTGATAGTFYDDIGSGNNLVPNTVFNIVNASGNFRVFNDPSGNADQVTLRATAARDLIEINQGNGVAQVLANNVTALLPVELGMSVEILNALGLGGQDTFQVIPAPGLAGQAQDNLLINLDGGFSGENNALVLGTSFGASPGTLPATSFAVVNRGATPDSGTVRVFQNAVANPDINYKFVQVVSPNVAGTSLNPNLLVMGADTFEGDNQLGNAAFLGSGDSLNVQNATIFPNSTEFPGAPADQDFYRVVAARTGILDFQVYFRTFNPGLLPGGGQLNLQAFDVAGNLIASAPGLFGADPGTGNARIRIPAVAGQTYYLRVFGSAATVVNGYNATILNTDPPAPYNLELSRSVPAGVAGTPDTGDLPTNAANHDSGRSQFDDVTNVNKPTIFVRLADGILLNDLPGNGVPNNPPAGVIPIPFSPNAATAGFRVAIFDGANTQNPVGFATPVGAGFPGLYSFTFTTALADGIHHIIAAVQMVDPANPTDTGFGPRSAISLDITVDTAPPPVSFGTTANGANGLDAGSDSGVPIDAPTLVDRVTNVTNPTFYGTAEANSIIRVFALDRNGATVLIGQTVATPLDGTNAFPNGRWVVQSNVNLNDPAFFNLDGTRTIRVTAEDLAGNVSAPSQFLIFVDTQGPQVASVKIAGSPGFNLFALKPDNAPAGPTPLVNALDLHFVDQPNRDAVNFPGHVALDALIAAAPGSYILKGDHSGIIAITQVIVTNDPVVNGQPATATVRLVFSAPLPDDRFTLTILDNITDPAGNKLDGESNAVEPLNTPTFPSGNGVAGGQFQARFTVDSRPEIGLVDHGQTRVDINANGVYDPLGSGDAVDHDLAFIFGLYTDSLFAGNFAKNGVANGFDKFGAYGKTIVNGANVFRFLLDLNGDGKFSAATGDLQVVSTRQINGLPVAGNFAPGHPGDEIGLFDGVTWYLDTNANNDIDFGDMTVTDGLRGYPIVGDFDGDGKVDLGTYQPDTNTFQFDLQANGFGQVDAVIHADAKLNAPAVAERPVAADMNQDGITDIGLYLPQGLDPQHPVSGNWYFLVSDLKNGPAPIAGTVNALDHVFNQTPFTQDMTYNFGNGFEVPIVGNFDPPLTGVAAIDKVFANSDFDADGKADFAAFDAGSATWNVQLSGGGSLSRTVGSPGDTPVRADFDGDGTPDLAAYHAANGLWTILTSSSDFTQTMNRYWGGDATDAALPIDLDGDGKADLAVFRARTGQWLITTAKTGYTDVNSFQWGQQADVPLNGDVDGDGKADLIVFRPNTGQWLIRNSSSGYSSNVSYLWGQAGDIPVTADFDGDGKADLAVHRPSTGQWLVLESSKGYSAANRLMAILGSPTDVGVVNDYDGDGKADVGAFNAAAGSFSVLTSSSNFATTQTATVPTPPADIPLSGDYDGDGRPDIAVFRPGTGQWFIRKSSTNFTTTSTMQWGQNGDVPLVGDFDGDGKADTAVFRPGSGQWLIRGSSAGAMFTIQFGQAGDTPFFGKLDGDNKADLLLYRPGTQQWFVRTSASGYSGIRTIQWGVAGDTPKVGDFDGDGKTDLLVYRPSLGQWFIDQSGADFTTSTVVSLGGAAGDLPVVGFFDGDKRVDLGVFRPSTGQWLLAQSTAGAVTRSWGLAGDVPLTGDFDGDGKSDLIVYRPTSGVWYIDRSLTNFADYLTYQWGNPLEIAI